MNPQPFDLNKIRIASPCSVGWNNLAGDDRKRFCASCELYVYNVAGMTGNEVRRLILDSNGRLCMRLRRRADGTLIMKDCPVGLRAYQKRVGRFAGATLAAILGLFSISFGQKVDNPDASSNVKIVRIVNSEKKARISGRIVDPVDNVIARAVVSILEKEVEKGRIVSNEDGEVQIKDVPDGNYKIKVISPGFKDLIIENLEIHHNESLQITIRLEIGDALMGVVMLADPEPVPAGSLTTPSLTEITPRKKP